jgi:chromosome segregation ATPase
LIEYDRKELARLEKHAESEDVYLEMLEEICESDTVSLKQYQERYRAAGEEVAKARVALEREVSATTVAQNEFESLSERFRTLHDERREVVDLWKNALVSLKSRECEMQLLAEVLILFLHYYFLKT